MDHDNGRVMANTVQVLGLTGVADWIGWLDSRQTPSRVRVTGLLGPSRDVKNQLFSPRDLLGRTIAVAAATGITYPTLQSSLRARDGR